MCSATQSIIFWPFVWPIRIYWCWFFSLCIGMESSSPAKGRFGLEKQEHLVKLAILTTAAILCEYFIAIHVENSKDKIIFEVMSRVSDFYQFFLHLQHLQLVCFQCCDLKVSSMNSIRISIIEPHDSLPNKDFIIFTIGLTIEHGIHWVVLSAEPFIPVWWSHRPYCTAIYGCWISPLTFAMCAYSWRHSFHRWPHWSRTYWRKRYT